jgi:CBS domain-containing protein
VFDAGTPAEEAGTWVDWREAAVHPETTLKDALSRMLGMGFRNVAVVDSGGRLVGEVSLADIESAMAGGDSYVADPAEADEPDERSEGGEPT